MICRPGEEEDTAMVGAVAFNRKEVLFMPGFDGTGPWGAGSMKGRGQGYCNTSSPTQWSDSNTGFGRNAMSGLARRFFRVFDSGYGKRYGSGRGAGRSRNFNNRGRR